MARHTLSKAILTVSLLLLIRLGSPFTLLLYVNCLPCVADIVLDKWLGCGIVLFI